MASNTEIRFDDWVLRGQPPELFHNGERVRLQEQPRRILEELLARPGEVVTREQLIARLWPKRVVDFDTALNAAVRRLRAALADEAETPRYIETIPRHGYRFIGTLRPATIDHSPVAVLPPPASEHRHPARWGIAMACIVLLAGASILGWMLRSADSNSAEVSGRAIPTVEHRALAVLPFVDLSEGQDQAYFSDGLTEDLIAHLAQALPLRVIARTSSFSFKGTNSDIAAVAGKLGVTHVLEGSVRKAGTHIRITAQLIDASTSSHLWAASYDRDASDILALQDEIATAVGGALQVVLVDTGPPAKVEPIAQELYQRAHFFVRRRAPGDLERSRHYYQQAIEADSKFARAWAELAGAYWLQAVTGDIDFQSGLDKVRSASERALALDPRLASAHLRLANYAWASGDAAAGDEHLRLAIAYEPQNPLVLSFSASHAARDGDLVRAIELQTRAVAQDPLATVIRSNLATFLLMARRFGSAEAEFRNVIELNPSYEPYELGHILIIQRRFDEALELTRRSALTSGHRAQSLALIYYGLGQTADADAALESLIRLSGENDPFAIAEVYAYRGDAEAAFHWLRLATEGDHKRRLLAERPRVVWAMPRSPFLDGLHADPRWQPWRTRMLAVRP